MAKIHWNACPLCFRQWCDCKLIEDQQKQIDAMTKERDRLQYALDLLSYILPNEVDQALKQAKKKAPAPNVGGKT